MKCFTSSFYMAKAIGSRLNVMQGSDFHWRLHLRKLWQAEPLTSSAEGWRLSLRVLPEYFCLNSTTFAVILDNSSNKFCFLTCNLKC